MAPNLTLRTPLPTSPIPRSIPPSPPPPTSPWVWQCHRCGHTFRLATTRRCLSCSHLSCLADASASRTRVCTSTFDYIGWAAYNEWRRDGLRQTDTPALRTPVRRHQRHRERRAEFLRKRDRHEKRMQRFVDRTHDCWVDCDYPSHCNNERYEQLLRTTTSPVIEESDDTSEAVTPAAAQGQDVDMKDACDVVAAYEGNKWFSWTVWEESSSESSSDEEVSMAERKKELEEFEELIRMNK